MLKISIIVPFFNSSSYLKECLESILEQPNVDLELIAINDGSTDDSLEIVNNIAAEDCRLTVASFENGGLSIARNRGLKIASNDYVMFVDSDDVLERNSLGPIAKHLKDENLDCCMFNGKVFYDGEKEKYRLINFDYERPSLLGVFSGTELFNEMIRLQKYNTSACMYIFRQSAMSDIQFYPNIYHEDNLFTTQLLLSQKLKRVSIYPLVVYLRRVRNNSIMTEVKSLKHLLGFWTVYEELKKTNTSDKITLKSLRSYQLRTLKKVVQTSYKIETKDNSKNALYWRLMAVKEYFLKGYFIDAPRSFKFFSKSILGFRG
ncbi:glycosyltransferase [Alteromonadaceae bacterium BrNp21-10]|nr:glycosyltransferase [Alteromonadaceae bacterium BrNp21-10]